MADVQVYRVVWSQEERAKVMAEGWSETRDPDGEYIPHTALPEIEQAPIGGNAAGVDAAEEISERAGESAEAQDAAAKRGRRHRKA